MMEYTQDAVERALAIWNQRDVPVITRKAQKGSRPMLRVPRFSGYAPAAHVMCLGADRWINQLGRSKPNWDASGCHWVIPTSWFNKVVDAALKEFGSIYIIQPYRKQEACVPACRNASGHDCQCSCMGANHGTEGAAASFDVGERFATRWDEEEIAVRLLRAR